MPQERPTPASGRPIDPSDRDLAPQAGFLRRTLDEARQALQAAPKDAAHVFARIAERLELDRE